jgi:hypothetical protein
MAIVELFQYARDHPEPDFGFGPLDLGQLENEGLAVSGRDLDGVRAILGNVPGLIPESI